MTRLALLLALAAAVLAPGSASAYWHVTGTGTGTGTTATVTAGHTPAATVSGQSVTVSWDQTAFQGSTIGARGGGYLLTRYPAGSSTPAAIGSACATKQTGSAATLSCTEAGVPYGAWEYTVTPVLETFTGDEGSRGAVAKVTTDPPTLTISTQNPAVGQTTGTITISGSPAAGTEGVRLYRRVAGGSYDYANPITGSAPTTATSYVDSTATAGVSYFYVARATAGSPYVESGNSNEVSATPISRPAAPASVTATAIAAADVNLDWPDVSGAAGYNVYRRTTGAYDYSSPINGATLVTGSSYVDTTPVDGTAYHYVVRAAITGAGGTQVEGGSSPESAAVSADATAPSAPTALTVTSGGNVTSTTACSVASGSRYLNAAGDNTVGVTTTLPTPESGETLLLTATVGSSTVTRTVAATGTSVATTLDVSSLPDGTVTLTVKALDAAGNASAAKSPTNAVIHDTVSTLVGVAYVDRTSTTDQVTGTAECGAAITAKRTVPASNTYTGTASTTSPFTFTVTAATQASGAYSYAVTAVDRAGNTSATTTLSGTAAH